jgi:MOSC domain-containing protein YiiM
VTLGVPTIDPGWLGANLVTRALPRLSRLPPGTRLFLPERATLVVADENHPCAFPGKALAHRYPDQPRISGQFVKAAQGRRGLVAWVERAGTITAGDTVTVALPPPVDYPLPGA